VSRAAFDAMARVASGSVPTTAVASYDVRVYDGRLRLAAQASAGVVLDVPLGRVGIRPLGRAGTSIVEVDGSPILVDFTRRDHDSTPGALGTARRVGPALRGRWLRGRFVSALRRGSR
jgi:hypothetical protein